ncbi:hypothetical protein FISHEDRAFT_75208 [Fistulina hepatica ATCC 64428]|uniref:Uncharacterized protein n=1 Tax=Fistulina hepatica ATCC 64428 TaxID=1128425 RepID=A0A0D7A795_9AGAR|nr:hypothetical protein FISHEDRAFT_75208 [Fistulina hepatica ATCC 64428]
MSGNSLGISDASLFSPRSSPTASTAGVRTFDDRSIVSNGGQINIPSCSYDRADRNSALSMQVAPSQSITFFHPDKSAHADETREAFYQLVKLLRDQRDDLQKCLNRKEEELSAVRTELKNAGKRNEQLQLSYSELEEKCKNYEKHEAAVRRVVRNFTKEFNEIDLLNSQEPEEVSATDEHSESEHPPAKRMRYNFRPANSNERRQSFILSASTRPSSTETFSEALAPRSHISEQPCLPPLAQNISTRPLVSTEGLPTFEEYSEMETTLLKSRKIPPYHKFWLSPDLQTYRILYEMLEEEKIEGPVPQFRKWLVENHAQLLLNLDNKHPEIPFPKYIDIAEFIRATEKERRICAVIRFVLLDLVTFTPRPFIDKMDPGQRHEQPIPLYISPRILEMHDIGRPLIYNVETVSPRSQAEESIVASDRTSGPPARCTPGNSLSINDGPRLSPSSSPAAPVRTFDDRLIVHVSNAAQNDAPLCSYDAKDRNSACAVEVAPAPSAHVATHVDETQGGVYELMVEFRTQRDSLQRRLKSKEEEVSAIRDELANANEINEQLRLSCTEWEKKCKNYEKRSAAYRHLVENFTKEFNEIDSSNSEDLEEALSASDEDSDSTQPPAKRKRYDLRPLDPNRKRECSTFTISTRSSSSETSVAHAPRSNISRQSSLPFVALYISTRPLASTGGLPTFEEYSEMEATYLKSRHRYQDYYHFWLHPDPQTYKILYEMLEDEKVRESLPRFREWLVENGARLLPNLDNKHPEIPFSNFIDIAECIRATK